MLIELLFALILAICVIWLFANLHRESDTSSGEKNLKDLEKVLEKVIQKSGGVGSGGMVTPAGVGSGPQSPTQAPLSAASEALLKMKIPDKPGGFPAPGGGLPGGLPGMGGGLPGAAAAAPKPTPIPISTPSPAPAPVPAAPSGPSAEQVAELNKLKAENETKAKKVDELEKAVTQAKAELQKAQAAAADSGAFKVNVDEFQKKIKELESRLGEYEIIEDDIANLSLYKDENARLKDELQKIKAGGVGAVVETPPAPKPAPVKQEPSISLKDTEPAPAPAAAPVPKSAAEASNDFPLDGAIDAAKLVAEVADLAAKPIEESPAADNKDSGDKLIEEFENFVKGGLDK